MLSAKSAHKASFVGNCYHLPPGQRNWPDGQADEEAAYGGWRAGSAYQVIIDEGLLIIGVEKGNLRGDWGKFLLTVGRVCL